MLEVEVGAKAQLKYCIFSFIKNPSLDGFVGGVQLLEGEMRFAFFQSDKIYFL